MSAEGFLGGSSPLNPGKAAERRASAVRRAAAPRTDRTFPSGLCGSRPAGPAGAAALPAPRNLPRRTCARSGPPFSPDSDIGDRRPVENPAVATRPAFSSGRPGRQRRSAPPLLPAVPPPSHNPLLSCPRKMAPLGAPRSLAAAASCKRRLLALALLRPPAAAAAACAHGWLAGSGRRQQRAPGNGQVRGGAGQGRAAAEEEGGEGLRRSAGAPAGLPPPALPGRPVSSFALPGCQRWGGGGRAGGSPSPRGGRPAMAGCRVPPPGPVSVAGERLCPD